MFARNSLLLALVGAVCCLAQRRVGLESPADHSLSESWVMTGDAPSESLLTLHFMMRHEPSDVAALEAKLFAVSDPRSPQYGRYLTLAEVGEIVPISAEKHDAVRAFLGDDVAVEPNTNGDILKVSLSASQAEALFETKLSMFKHASLGVSLMRATAPYTVPEAVAEAVSVVADLATLPRMPMKPQSAPLMSPGGWDNACPDLSCKGLITPQVLKKRYSVPDDSTGMESKNNSMSVAEFQGQYFKQSDLDKFSAGCNVSVKVDTIIGGNQESAGVEAELDIEYIRGVSPEIPLTVVYSADYSLSDWMKQISSMDPAPLVHSVSYGNDEKQQTSTAYMLSTNTQFMAAGVRGISILFASGDQGVCGREGCGIFSKRFKPDFPAGSPYVTAVGGTDFAGNGIGEETAWSASGGGFSDTFDIPSYQTDAVASYKSSATLPTASLYNNTGRGYPDISALGGQKTPYCVVANGAASGVAGTSASSPTAAAIFARLNGLRLAAGKPPMGFLNPFIYQNGGAFNDVTSGSNACMCGFGSKQGFEAIKGWDPVTGMGTPNFESLKDAAMSMY